MLLNKLRVGETGCISSVGGSEKIKRFLNTLGCSIGEEVTLVSVLSGNYVINIKDSRYAIDSDMAKAIELMD